jgi:ribose/xylose/arabinose/galactoside ABC-type transport system permease subunit
MSEETEEPLRVDIVAGILSLFFGLIAPLLFNALTWSQQISFCFIIFCFFAACILYGELGLSVASGVAFGFGMLLTSFAAQNWSLIGLAISGVAINLAKNWQSESSAIEPEDAGFDLLSSPSQ